MESRRILIVEPDAPELARLQKTLDDVGHLTYGVETFAEAAQQLDRQAPDVLIANVRLGAFNGLHLVIRSSFEHPEVSAVVLDRLRDPVLEAEATRLGARYRAYPLHTADLVALAAVDRPLGRWTPVRRWPRIRPLSNTAVQVAGSPARIVDVSYGGARFTVAPERGNAVRSTHALMLPRFGVSIDAETVWTRPDASSGNILFGAEVSETDAAAVEGWRQFVDRAAYPAAI